MLKQHKAIIIRTDCFWLRNRHKDQRNRIKSPETDLHEYDQLIFNKVAKAIQSFQQMAKNVQKEKNTPWYIMNYSIEYYTSYIMQKLTHYKS